MINIIKDSLSEDNGNISSMRWLAALIVIVTLGNWTYINIVTQTFTQFDWQSLGLIIGTLFTKAYQKGKEK